MASYVENPSHRMCGLRPRCSDFPRAEAPPHPGEADGAREVPLPGYKSKCRQYIKFRSGLGRVNSSHQRKSIEQLGLRRAGWYRKGSARPQEMEERREKRGARDEGRNGRRQKQEERRNNIFFEQQQLTDRVCEKGGQ